AEFVGPVCTIGVKTWALRVEKVVRVDPTENLAMIAESVAFLVGAGKRVIYDAEHFFDAYCGDASCALDCGPARRGISDPEPFFDASRDDAAYALDCLRAAAGAGAETVAICDTNGSSL